MSKPDSGVGQEADDLRGRPHRVAQGPKEPANLLRTMRFSRLVLADFTSASSRCGRRLDRAVASRTYS
jgi:hypothetical protein